MQINRRQLVRWGASIATGSFGSLLPFSSAPLAQAGENTPRNMAQWMDSWTGIRARDPVGGLFVYRFREPMWALLKPIGWVPDDPASKLQPVSVPSGFVTDFASIPRAFYSLLRPDGEYTYPAIVHDYLYWTQLRTRSESDDVFRLMMQEFKIGSGTVRIIYNAVRKFGQSAWDKNAELRKKGEKRILAKFPDDPRITWEDWKRQPKVFAE